MVNENAHPALLAHLQVTNPQSVVVFVILATLLIPVVLNNVSHARSTQSRQVVVLPLVNLVRLANTHQISVLSSVLVVSLDRVLILKHHLVWIVLRVFSMRKVKALVNLALLVSSAAILTVWDVVHVVQAPSIMQAMQQCVYLVLKANSPLLPIQPCVTRVNQESILPL